MKGGVGERVQTNRKHITSNRKTDLFVFHPWIKKKQNGSSDHSGCQLEMARSEFSEEMVTNPKNGYILIFQKQSALIFFMPEIPRKRL